MHADNQKTDFPVFWKSVSIRIHPRFPLLLRPYTFASRCMRFSFSN